jgi:hypothetical protein
MGYSKFTKACEINLNIYPNLKMDDDTGPRIRSNDDYLKY